MDCGSLSRLILLLASSRFFFLILIFFIFFYFKFEIFLCKGGKEEKITQLEFLMGRTTISALPFLIKL